MGSTYTLNLNLRKPDHRDADTLEAWSYVLNNNFDLIDTAFGLRSYTEQNYISNSDALTASLNKLDMKLYDIEQAVIGGSSSIARKVIIPPEYAGAVLYDGGFTPSAGAKFISDFEITGAYGFNFYKWLSDAGAFDTYYVVVRWRAPESFVGFNPTLNNALIIDLCTDDTGTDTYAGVTIFKDGFPGVTSSIGPLSSAIAGAWHSHRAGNGLLSYDATNPVLSTIVAGSTLVMMIGLSSQNSSGTDKWVKIGDITIQYNG
jgi:hypothetical protein